MEALVHDLFPIVVAAILAVVGFLMVFVLNSIRGEIREIKKSLTSVEKDLRDGVSTLDRRITILETRFSDHRRSENGDN